MIKNPKNPIPKRLYTLKDSSGYLSLGLHGVRNLVWSGQIPVVRIGRKMFIDLDDLQKFVSQNKRVYSD